MKLINSVENFQKYNIIFSSCGYRFKEYINNYKISQIPLLLFPRSNPIFHFQQFTFRKGAANIHSPKTLPSIYARKEKEKRRAHQSTKKLINVADNKNLSARRIGKNSGLIRGFSREKRGVQKENVNASPELILR